MVSGMGSSTTWSGRTVVASIVPSRITRPQPVANNRWLIAAGIRDLQAMLDELGKLQTGLPRDAPAPDEPIHD
jgi:hypothetical protein